jgi:alkane 1-monooxygenase
MPVIAKYGVATLLPLALLIGADAVWGGLGRDRTPLADADRGGGGPSFWTRPLRRAPMVHGPTGSLDPSRPGSLRSRSAGPLGARGPGSDPGQKIALFAATASFIGQVSHPNAHELIHRKSRFPAGSARWSMSHGLRAPRLGPPAGASPISSPRAGPQHAAHGRKLLALPAARLGREASAPGWRPRRPPARRGLPASGPEPLLALDRRRDPRRDGSRCAGRPRRPCLPARPLGAHRAQILMSDYIQHYGLTRLPLPSGRIGTRRSAPQLERAKGFSSYLMLNAPSHSEHHCTPIVATRPWSR